MSNPMTPVDTTREAMERLCGNLDDINAPDDRDGRIENTCEHAASMLRAVAAERDAAQERFRSSHLEVEQLRDEKELETRRADAAVAKLSVGIGKLPSITGATPGQPSAGRRKA